jgi:hypothetical protein
LPRRFRFLAAVEDVLIWLLSYPLLPLQLLLLMLIAWGGLGKSLGFRTLFWSEYPFVQFLNGLACGWLFGEILTIRYLLDRRRTSENSTVRTVPIWDRLALPFTLFPCREPTLRRLGAFLLIFWPATLLLLAGGALLRPSFWLDDHYVAVWPMFAGLGVSVLLAAGLVLLRRRTGFRAWVQGTWLFRRLPGVAWKTILTDEHPLHALALEINVLFLTGAVTAVLFGINFPPVVVLCLLLGTFNGLYGFVAFQLRGLQHIVFVAAVVLGLVLGTDIVYPDRAYKLTFPNLDYGELVPIDEDSDGHDHYYELLKEQAENPSSAPSLINSEDPLRAMLAQWQQEHKDGTKPPLVVVATSGGGIRAAVWTAVVFEGLEHEIPGVRKRIRLITGASGGMVGAALYVADFEYAPTGPPQLNADTGLNDRLSGALARDSLTPTVNRMLLRDLPLLWWPRPVSDRGRTLEKAWQHNTKPPDGRVSPFERTFEELKTLEREGKRPSLVFSPMLVEDSRRLLISNLDLLDLTWTQGDVRSFEPFNKQYDFPRCPNQPLLSLSAVEFFRLFPKATGFQVSTAARMNASFPLVSPAVSLPTKPPRRVVDAGYYDNFGTNLAAMWLYRYRDVLPTLTSGVVLIEIRAQRNGYARWHFQDKEAERTRPDPHNRAPRPERDLLAQGLEWLITPVQATLTEQERGAYYRNDELLHVLDKHFNRDGDRFFTTVAFECSVDASLSWTLPQSEAAQIGHAFYCDPARRKMRPWVDKRVGALKSWLDERGKKRP